MKKGKGGKELWEGLERKEIGGLHMNLRLREGRAWGEFDHDGRMTTFIHGCDAPHE